MTIAAEPAPGTPGRLARYAGIMVLVAACALSLAGVIARDARQGLIPTDDAIAAAVKEVRDGYRDGDQVRVVPSWVERLWHPLNVGSGGVPAKALHHGHRVDPVELLSAKRVWVIATYGEPAAVDFDGLELGEPLQRVDVGSGVTVALFDVPTRSSIARITDQVGRLKVSRKPLEGRARRCTLKGAVHRCGKPWQNVRTKRDDVFHRPVNWLSTVPGPSTTALIIEWPLSSPGAKTLIVRAGLGLKAMRDANGGIVTLRVFVDGALGGQLMLAPHRYALKRLRLDVSPTSKVRFELSTTDHKARWVMLQANVMAESLPASLDGWFDAGEGL